MSSVREAVFQALLLSEKEERFIDDSLKHWNAEETPDTRDYQLAKEIAFGVCRRKSSLDYMAETVSDRKQRRKLKEKILLRMGIYQLVFLDRIPSFAVVNEMVELAKKYTHQTFVRYLNALLRKVTETPPTLPKGNSVAELAIRYSYPEYFVQELMHDFALEEALEILDLGNRAAVTMARVRDDQPLPEGIEQISKRMIIVNETKAFKEVVSSPRFYVQNCAQADLIKRLCKQIEEPKRVLDLCASPGGKLIAVHDHFPKASLFANDVSEKKLVSLRENCQKYGVEAKLSCSRGEEFQTAEQFDLIIVDAPCSNTGVLNKRPEARWRLSKESVDRTIALQKELLRRAATLLAPGGKIFYLTCSILQKENQKLIHSLAKELSLEICDEALTLPNQDGSDGGYGALLVL